MAKIGKYTYLICLKENAALAGATVRLAGTPRRPKKAAILGISAGFFGPLTVK
jgi:hypothetical protein